MIRTLRLTTALVVLAAVAASRPAAAEGFSTANVQLLQGFNFEDASLGLETDDGWLTTLTFNHFSTWAYGDSFLFVDLYRGVFPNPGGEPEQDARMYAEWHPRLLFGQLLGVDRFFGVFRDFGIAAEYNQGGTGYYAYLAGVGGDFALPGPITVGLNVFYKYDRFVESTWQISPYWTVPFNVGSVPMLFAGFLDVSGTDDIADGGKGIDLLAQPQLLVDVLGLAGGAGNRLLLGVEWYVHVRPERTESVPQVMAQWTIH